MLFFSFFFFLKTNKQTIKKDKEKIEGKFVFAYYVISDVTILCLKAKIIISDFFQYIKRIFPPCYA